MSFTSIPVIPAQPDQAEYPASELQTLAVFTYESYLTSAGAASPWDPTRPEQYWFDSSADAAVGAIYQYSALLSDASGNPVIGPQIIPAVWALTPNIPPPQSKDTNPIQPVPVRPLLPNEQLYVSPDGGGPGISEVYVLRTDLQGTLPAQYTESDKAIIVRLGAYLEKLGA